jgi:hypothetical protein
MAFWRTFEPVKRIWRFGGVRPVNRIWRFEEQLNLLIDMVIWRTVEPVKRIWRFGGHLNMLNGYGALEDS